MPFTTSPRAASDLPLRREGLFGMRRAVYGHLSLQGLRVLELSRVDFVLSRLSRRGPVDPLLLGAGLGCDTVLFGEAETYRKVSPGVHSVAARLRLLRARDGQAIWVAHRAIDIDITRQTPLPIGRTMGLDIGKPGLIVADELARQLVGTIPAGKAMVVRDPTWPAPRFFAVDPLAEAQTILREIDRDPRKAAAHDGYARYLLRQGDYGEALAAVDMARKIEPHDPGTAFFAVRILIRANRLNAAEQTLLQVIALAPDDAAALNFLGYAYSRLGRHEDALAVYAMALEREPVNGFAYYNVAVTLFDIGDLESAREVFYRAGLAHYCAGRFDLTGPRAVADLRALAVSGIDVSEPLNRLEADLAQSASSDRKDV